MNLSIGSAPDATAALGRLHDVLATATPRVVACSGGIDSLVLATVAHRADAGATTVAHTVTPAVPSEGTERVLDHARREGWNLEVVRSREFDDERYLANPADRCYHCKRNLYDAVGALRTAGDVAATIVSGANLDDLGEYRPGLVAAAERDVRHPFVEASIAKRDVRAIARRLGLSEAGIPASPCLASRLYTGTRVTPERLRAVEAGEAVVRDLAGVDVVRCRLDDRGDGSGEQVRIEVADVDRHRIDASVIDAVARAMRAVCPSVADVELDHTAYHPGRAVRFSA